MGWDGGAFLCTKLTNISITDGNSHFQLCGHFVTDFGLSSIVLAFGTDSDVTIPNYITRLGSSSFAGRQSARAATFEPDSQCRVIDGPEVYQDNLWIKPESLNGAFTVQTRFARLSFRLLWSRSTDRRRHERLTLQVHHSHPEIKNGVPHWIRWSLHSLDDFRRSSAARLTRNSETSIETQTRNAFRNSEVRIRPTIEHDRTQPEIRRETANRLKGVCVWQQNRQIRRSPLLSLRKVQEEVGMTKTIFSNPMHQLQGERAYIEFRTR
jgi:hypothetical protein